jgi:hypothetical protein
VRDRGVPLIIENTFLLRLVVRPPLCEREPVTPDALPRGALGVAPTLLAWSVGARFQRNVSHHEAT